MNMAYLTLPSSNSETYGVFLNLTETACLFVGFQVLTVVRMKMAVFWVVLQCSLGEEYLESFKPYMPYP
jgi:hypothetical protein